MTTFYRAAFVTCVALFLEGFAIYLVGRLLSGAIRLPEASIPLGIAMVAIGWSFILSWYVQNIRFSLNLRGTIGLIVSALSVLALAGISMGAGWFPIGLVFSGDLNAIAALSLAAALLLLLWWRGAATARDDVTLDAIRNAFVRGAVVVIVAVAADALLPAHVNIISLPILVLYFAVGLGGLALSRFAIDSGVGQISRRWLLAIVVSVGAVLLLALILGAVGVGGLDEVARAIVRGIAFLGLWTLRPILLLLGLLAAGLVAIGNWISGFFGGGDLSGLELAQLQIEEFHESLREVDADGPPNAILTVIKWLAFLLAVSLAGWILFRMFRRRRLAGSNYADTETRESTFTLQAAGQDIADALAGWFNWAGKLNRRRPRPANPREVYHRMLDVARAVGFTRRTWQTPQEHRREANQALPDQPMGRIVGEFQRYHYGPQPNNPDPDTMRSLEDDLNDLQRN